MRDSQMPRPAAIDQIVQTLTRFFKKGTLGANDHPQIAIRQETD
jgi:hypothetical protein